MVPETVEYVLLAGWNIHSPACPPTDDTTNCAICAASNEDKEPFPLASPAIYCVAFKSGGTPTTCCATLAASNDETPLTPPIFDGVTV